MLAFKDKGLPSENRHRIKLILLSLETLRRLSSCQTTKQNFKGMSVCPTGTPRLEKLL